MPQHITVTDYNPEWSMQYEREKERITAVLKENCIAIYHIGSTSVPGLAAKPVIDIMAAAGSLERADDAAEDFSELGYEYLGEFGIAGRRYLRKGGDERTHQIHIFQADDWSNLERHLAFRDYMRTHENERNEYAEIKRSLARKFPYDIDGYCDGKDDFVQRMEKKALSRFDGTWDRLYLAARKAQYEWKTSSASEAGCISAAILTKNGNLYVGACRYTDCSSEMCAERTAIDNMLKNGESRIMKIAVVTPDGKTVKPWGVFRKFMMQSGQAEGETEILCGYEPKKVMKYIPGK